MDIVNERLRGAVMPTESVVMQYVALIEGNEHLRAVELFYAPDAKVQENAAAPMVGVRTLTARKASTLAKVRSVRAKLVRPIIHNGDLVALRWIYYFELLNDRLRRVEEIALQQWRGEQIVSEHFFFDPGQMTKDL
jgi:hypothetical protein